MAERAFIDIAVLDEVRDALLAGDAVLVLDEKADKVVWASAEAPALFGVRDVAAMLDGDVAGLHAARRQLLAAARSAQSAGMTPVLLRLSGQLVRADIAVTHADDGEPFIVMRVTDAQAGDERARLDRILAGFADTDAGAAITDGRGTILASNFIFETLGMDADILAGLDEEVASEADRLVKRQVPTNRDGIIAAGIGRLREGDNARNLLLCIVIEEGVAEINDPIEASGDVVVDDAHPAEFHTTANTVETEAVLLPLALVDNDGAEAEPIGISESDRMAEDDTPSPSHVETNDAAEPVSMSESELSHLEQNVDVADQTAPESEPADLDLPLEDVMPDFSFEPTATPIRFVWKMDADCVFRDISDEFRATVGPAVSDIEGQAFDDVAARLALDTDGEIAASLARRDTWSGKTVLWPVQGTDLRVPVDLAALPYYNRDRVFEGYRGFGVIRVADAVIDPDLDDSELRLVDDLHDDTARAALGDDEPAINPETADSAADEADPFHGEPPVFATTTPVGYHGSEQTLRMVDEPPARLNAQEQKAFETIGRALAADAGQSEDEIGATGSSAGESAQTSDESAHSVAGPVSDEADADDVSDLSDLSAAAPELSTPDETIVDDTADAPTPLFLAPQAEHEDTAPSAIELESADPDQSDEMVELGPDEAVGHGGIDRDVIDGLPLALLIVRNENAVFANMAFQLMTGHDDIEDLNRNGGLDALIVGPASHIDVEEGEMVRRAMTLVAADGSQFAARAHMQIVPFEGVSSLMFAFEPVNQDLSESTPYVSAKDVGTFDEDAPVDEPSPPTKSNIVSLTGQRAPVADDSARMHTAALDVEEELQSHIEELESILDIASDGIVILKTDGSIRSINGPASALFGYDRDEVEGKSFGILFAHESQKASLDYLYSLTNNGVASLLNEGREVLGREKNGGFLPLFMTMARLPSQDALCAVMRDITPWKQSEQALVEATKVAKEASASKSEFLAKISHEIRTPLNAIIGFSELIQEERFGPLNNQRYREYMGDINRSGRHVLELVNDLLDLSKIEAGKQDLHFGEVDLNALTEDAISMVQPQAAAGRILLRSSLSPNLPKIVADARSIRQIILNLLSNSVRFTHSGGLIVAGTSYEPNRGAVLRIKDTGVGMTDKEIELAMQPFQQVAESGTTSSGGTGLGLPLTKALVEANRAEFAIHSEPGRGTIVEITFPENRVIHT